MWSADVLHLFGAILYETPDHHLRAPKISWRRRGACFQILLEWAASSSLRQGLSLEMRLQGASFPPPPLPPQTVELPPKEIDYITTSQIGQCICYFKTEYMGKNIKSSTQARRKSSLIRIVPKATHPKILCGALHRTILKYLPPPPNVFQMKPWLGSALFVGAPQRALTGVKIPPLPNPPNLHSLSSH